MKRTLDGPLGASNLAKTIGLCGLLLLVLGFAVQAIRGNIAGYEATAVLRVPVAEEPTASTAPATILRGAQTESQELRRALGRNYNVRAIPWEDTWGLEVRAQRDSEDAAVTAVARAELVEFRAEEMELRAADRAVAIGAEQATLLREKSDLEAALGRDADLPIGPIPSYLFSFEDGESYVDIRTAQDPSFSPIGTVHQILRLNRVETALADLADETAQLGALEPFLTQELSEIETVRVPRSGFAIRDLMKVVGTLLLVTAAMMWLARAMNHWFPRWYPQIRLLAIGALVLWVVMIAATLVQVRSGVDRAATGLKPLEESKNAADLITDIDATRSSLVDASDELTTVGNRLDAPWMWPLHAIPGLQIPWDASKDLLNASRGAADVTVTFLDETQAAIDQLNQNPTRRVRALSRIGVSSRKARAELSRIRVPARPSLPGPVRGQHNRLERNLDSATTQLTELADALEVLSGLLSTDGEWLLIGGNNAENRLSMGSLDQLGTITIRDEQIEIGEIRGDTSPRTLWNVPNQIRNLEPGEIANYDADLNRNFGVVPMDQFWVALGLSPRFEASAELSSQMWTSVTGQTARGVIYVDSVALADITTALGGITVNAQELTGDDVLAELVVNQYQGGLNREDRYRESQELTRVVMEDLQQTSDVTGLAGGLLNAVADRHIMFWTPDPEIQERADRLNLSGATSPISHGVSLASFSGRWDDFVDIEIEADTACDDAQLTAETRITISFRGTVDDAESFGLEQVWGEPDGTFVGLLAVTLPGTATVTNADLGPFNLGVQRDGSAQMASALIRLSAGESSVFTVPWSSPELRRIETLADGRSRPNAWTVHSSAADSITGRGGFAIRTC